MKKTRIIFLTSLCLLVNTINCFAAETETTEETQIETDDEFDLIEEQKKIDELGIPTISSVDQMKLEVDKLYDEKKYEEAAEAYHTYAMNANWLANILAGTLDPYYHASYDDKDKVDSNLVSVLAKMERKSNYYKSERNRAYLREGLCYYAQKDYYTALPLLLNALELIEVNETDIWKQGFNAVAKIVEYDGN